MENGKQMCTNSCNPKGNSRLIDQFFLEIFATNYFIYATLASYIGTQIIPDIGIENFTTSGASQAGSELKSATSTLLAVIVPLSVILLIIAIFIVHGDDCGDH